MTTENETALSVNPPKYRRGENPASRANLRAPWQPGESGNGKHSGPMLTPALRKYAEWSLEELEELWEDPPPSLTVAEAIAITSLIDALKTGSFTTGSKSRELVFSRIDGVQKAADVEVNVAVGVKMTWHDGEQA